MINNIISKLVIFFLLNNLTSFFAMRFIGAREVTLSKRVPFAELTPLHHLLLEIRDSLYCQFDIVQDFKDSKYFIQLDPVKYHQYLMASRKCKQMYPNPYPDSSLRTVEIPSISFLLNLVLSKKCRKVMREIDDSANQCTFYQIMDFGSY